MPSKILIEISNLKKKSVDPSGIYLVNVHYGNTRRSCEICSKLSIKTTEKINLVLVSLLIFQNFF